MSSQTINEIKTSLLKRTKEVVSTDRNLFSIPETADKRRAKAWLADRIQKGQSQVTMEVVTISPILAELLLESNTSNRHPRDSVIGRYARQMNAGTWKLTGETIIVSATGRLLNGQHRLLAAKEAASSFPSIMVFGIEDAAFSFMDTGSPRGAGDVFGIYGVPNANAMAAATLRVYRFREMGFAEFGGGDSLTNEEVYEYYQTLPHLQESYTTGQRFSVFKLAPPALMSAFHYLCAQKNRQQADEFFEKVATGIGLEAKEPATTLRNRLIDNKGAQSRLKDPWIAAYTVLAWNAQRQRKKTVQLRWRAEASPDEKFPVIV